MPIEKKFDFSAREKELFSLWERSAVFDVDMSPSSPEEKYSIVLPPPNITGHLHIGHALNATLQDVIVRYQRMCKKCILWQPGVDHAGIATQILIEKRLKSQGKSRLDIGRVAFIKEVYKWKEENRQTIIEQLKILGASLSFSKERFTMDAAFAKLVHQAFVSLYQHGFIYRDKRLVNWDPSLGTAISDLEVMQKEVVGHMYYVKYPLHQSSDYVTIATTRPETMFGDQAIAVHPKDERYKHLIGATAYVPLTGNTKKDLRRIPIIADDYVDPKSGSGCVKITPAHDFNDFKVGQRHNLSMLNILNKDGTLNELVPPSFRNLTVKQARKSVIDALENSNLIEKVDAYTHKVPHGDRSNTVIEPYLTDQWYVDAKRLASQAISWIQKKDIVLTPASWEKTFFVWMKNLEPWCISRQLWWGHRIPVWYIVDAKKAHHTQFFVAMNEEDAIAQVRNLYGVDDANTIKLIQDDDVLDTWFSSGLWAFGSLSENTYIDIAHHKAHIPENIKNFYPTNILVTGFDIIFFWVSRMMFLSSFFTNTIPFKQIYVHALIRDEQGQKMSKSKGNIVDPKSLIHTYGADALRLTLCALAVQGRSIRLSFKRVEGYRNFITKLWNTARFCQMHEAFFKKDFCIEKANEPLNIWIIHRLKDTISKFHESINKPTFNETVDVLYHFVWHTLCDWYIELIKPALYSNDDLRKEETKEVLGFVFGQTLKILHPIIPFVTEELWQQKLWNDADAEPVLANVHFLDFSSPTYTHTSQLKLKDAHTPCFCIEKLIKIIAYIRSLRSQFRIEASCVLQFHVTCHASNILGVFLKESSSLIEKMTRLKITFYSLGDTAQSNKEWAHFFLEDVCFSLELKDVHLDEEILRIKNNIENINSFIEKNTLLLSNENFLSKARDDIIEEKQFAISSEKKKKKDLEVILDALLK